MISSSSTGARLGAYGRSSMQLVFCPWRGIGGGWWRFCGGRLDHASRIAGSPPERWRRRDQKLYPPTSNLLEPRTRPAPRTCNPLDALNNERALASDGKSGSRDELNLRVVDIQHFHCTKHSADSRTNYRGSKDFDVLQRFTKPSNVMHPTMPVFHSLTP